MVKKTSSLVLTLTIVSVLMFVFAIWVMPPLYRLFCEVTGIGLQTNEFYQQKNEDFAINSERWVKVQFLAANNADMSWHFAPKVFEKVVKVGVPNDIIYVAINGTQQDMVAQAVPNISPSNAVNYFHKTECFCFNRQPLQANDAASLTMTFIIDPELPPQVNTISILYTLFDITEYQQLTNNEL